MRDVCVSGKSVGRSIAKAWRHRISTPSHPITPHKHTDNTPIRTMAKRADPSALFRGPSSHKGGRSWLHCRRSNRRASLVSMLAAFDDVDDGGGGACCCVAPAEAATALAAGGAI